MKQGDMMTLQCSKRPGRHEEWKGTNHHHLLAEFVLGILQGEVTRKPSSTHLDQQMSPALYEAYIGLLPSASCDLSAPDSRKQPAKKSNGCGQPTNFLLPHKRDLDETLPTTPFMKWANSPQ